jgi:hypothetical protein
VKLIFNLLTHAIIREINASIFRIQNRRLFMRKLFTCCLFMVIVTNGFAQRRKTVFVEALGNGLTVSGNFDLRLKANQNDGLGLRAGIGGGSLSGTDDQGNSASIGIVTFPLAVNYLVGKKRSAFESGIGITPVYVSTSGRIDNDAFSGSGLALSGFLNLGYRYQPVNNGFMGHIKWTPAITSTGFSPSWFGLGIGYSFK